MWVLDHGSLKLPLKLLLRQSGWLETFPRERKFSVCFSRTNSQEIFHGIERASEFFFFFGEKVRGRSWFFRARLENLAIEGSFGSEGSRYNEERRSTDLRRCS